MTKIYILIMVFICCLSLAGCDDLQNYDNENYINNYEDKDDKNKNKDISKEVFDAQKDILADRDGLTILTRYEPPKGYERVEVEKNSFGEYIRNKKLKPYGSKAKYYNGKQKDNKGIYDSVFDYDIGKHDLHHAADAIMFLRAEYLYQNGMFSDISYSFANGFKAEYSNWAAGYRIRVRDNLASWHKSKDIDNSYENFMKYMNMIFAYCTTITMEKDMNRVHIYEMQIGDVFLVPGNPGSAAVVIDMAINSVNGDKIFMVAQAGSPAQQMQIISNSSDKAISPWFRQNFDSLLLLDKSQYSKYDLMRFK